MKKITKLVGLLLLSLFMMNSDCNKPSTAKTEGKITENQQRIHLKTTQPPILTNSVERQNLIRRLTRFNVPNKISYIYLFTFGRVVGYYAIKGKVSSVNSLLTNPMIRNHTHSQSGDLALPSPDLDGSYGSNGDAVFFFTTQSIYVEWNDKYLLTDQPIFINAKRLNKQ